MEEQKEMGVICYRQVDMPTPPVPSTLQKCRECGFDVWIDNNLLQVLQANGQKVNPLCMTCFGKLREEGKVEIEVGVHPATLETLNDVLKHRAG